ELLCRPYLDACYARTGSRQAFGRAAAVVADLAAERPRDLAQVARATLVAAMLPALVAASPQMALRALARAGRWGPGVRVAGDAQNADDLFALAQELADMGLKVEAAPLFGRAIDIAAQHGDLLSLFYPMEGRAAALIAAGQQDLLRRAVDRMLAHMAAPRVG